MSAKIHSDLEAELLRFAKLVRDYSNDAWIARAADALVILHGDPDVKPPRGVIRAKAKPLGRST